MLKSALSLLLVSCLLGRLDCTEFTVKRGADAILQCSGPKDGTEIMISWEKPELQSEGYLLFFKDGQFQEELQHELFKGRVELKDPDWKKTGDFSVILKHVTTNDAGTYECRAAYEGQRPELLSSLILKVEKPGQTEEQKQDGGNEGEEKEEEGKEHGSARPLRGAIFTAVAAVVVAVGGFMIYKKKCRNTSTQQNSYQEAPQREEQDGSKKGGGGDTCLKASQN